MSARGVAAAAALAVLFCVVAGLPLVAAYVQRQSVVVSSRAACERTKLDRADNAAGWTAHRNYITQVTGAASVKEDVKAAARGAVKTYARISVSLTERSLIDCADAYPDASLMP